MGHQGPKKKKNRKTCSVFDANKFFETATKNKNFNMSSDFYWVRIFWHENVFSVCTAPIGGTRGQKRKKVAPFLTQTHFLKPQREIKILTFFSIFSGQFFLSFFCRPGISLCPKPLQKPVNRDFFSRKNRVKPPTSSESKSCATRTRFQWAETFPKTPRWRRVGGWNGFSSVGFPTDRTGP